MRDHRRPKRHEPSPQAHYTQVTRASHHDGADRATFSPDLADAAELIGVALRHARLGGFRPGAVPNTVLSQLGWHALKGDAAAMLTLEHLHRRALGTIKSSDGSIRLEPRDSLVKSLLRHKPPAKVIAVPRPVGGKPEANTPPNDELSSCSEKAQGERQ